MPLFRYKARSTHGDAVDGTIEASSSDTAAALLFESGLTPIDIHPHVEQASVVNNLNQLLLPKVGNTDLIQFSRQMHSMLRAGIPIFRAVGGLADTTSNVKLKHILHDVMRTLESGRTLSEGFSQHPGVFSVFLSVWFALEKRPANYRKYLNSWPFISIETTQPGQKSNLR